MSLKITRDGIRGLYIIKPKGIEAVETDSVIEVGAAVMHYFDAEKKNHDIYKRHGVCPLCRAMEKEN